MYYSHRVRKHPNIGCQVAGTDGRTYMLTSRKPCVSSPGVDQPYNNISLSNELIMVHRGWTKMLSRLFHLK